MPKMGTLPNNSAIVAAIAPSAAGSPGPLERNTPSGSMAKVSSAEKESGHDRDGGETAKDAQHGRFDSEVVGDDPKAPLTSLITELRRHLRHEVTPGRARFGKCRREELGVVRGPKSTPHGTVVSEDGV